MAFLIIIEQECVLLFADEANMPILYDTLMTTEIISKKKPESLH
jgi:hypothetical protein